MIFRYFYEKWYFTDSGTALLWPSGFSREQAGCEAQLCGWCCAPMEGTSLREAALARLPRLHHRGLSRNGRKAGASWKCKIFIRDHIKQWFLMKLLSLWIIISVFVNEGVCIRQWSYCVIIFLIFVFQGEMVQWTIFLISYWGDQIGQKVKKICDW